MATKKLYEIPEFQKIVPMSTAGIYKACSEGKIPTVKVGRRVFIPAWYIDEITSKPGAQQMSKIVVQQIKVRHTYWVIYPDGKAKRKRDRSIRDTGSVRNSLPDNKAE